MRRATLAWAALAAAAVLVGIRWSGRDRSAVGTAAPPAGPAPVGADAGPRETAASAARSPPDDEPGERVAVETDREEGDAPEPTTTLEGVTVLVVDADGEPVAGVPVALLGRIDGVPGGDQRFATATTDARGTARLVEEEEDRERRRLLREGTDLRFLLRVEADVLCEPRPAHELGAEPAPVELVRLALPPFGSARVRVATPDGGAVPADARVFPTWRPLGSAEDFTRVGAPREPVVDGVARFGVLPLGQEYRFDATGGKAYRSGRAEVDGPTRAGEGVDVEVVLGPPLAAVVGRLVGEDGTPLADVSVSMALFALDGGAPPDAEPERPPWLWEPLDGDGRFRRFTGLEPEAGQRLALLVHEESRHTPSAVDRFARWDGFVALPPGAEVDVGTLVLRPHARRRLLIAGRVVAADGERLRFPAVDVGHRDPASRAWVRLPDDRVEVGSDGSFEAWTVLEDVPERFTVSAGARGCLGVSVEASPGDRGLVLVLERGGGLSGRFVADDPTALPLLAVRIEGENFRREPDIGLGAFRVDSLPPGTYSVIAKGHGTDWRFGAVDGVVVPRGDFALDPRLERIDLGDACRVLRLAVLGPDGEPLAKRWVTVQDRARDGGNFRTDEGGNLVALVPATADELGLSVAVDGARIGARWTPAAGYAGTITLRETER